MMGDDKKMPFIPSKERLVSTPDVLSSFECPGGCDCTYYVAWGKALPSSRLKRKSVCPACHTWLGIEFKASTLKEPPAGFKFYCPHCNALLEGVLVKFPPRRDGYLKRVFLLKRAE